MKINRLQIPEGYKGLHAAQMTTLSNVVLIDGPNGGGKLRILQAIRDNFNRSVSESLGALRTQLAKSRKEAGRLQAFAIKAPPANHSQGEV